MNNFNTLTSSYAQVVVHPQVTNYAVINPESNIAKMDQIYTTSVKPSFQPFQLKKVDSYFSYVASPKLYEIVEDLKIIQPIPNVVLDEKYFKINKSIKLVNGLAYQLGFSYPDKIEPFYLNNPQYVEAIKLHIDSFITHLKKYSTLKSAIQDRVDRETLIKEICKKNTSTFKKILKTDHRFTIVKIVYNFEIQDIDQHGINLDEQHLKMWIQKTTESFYEHNQTELLTAFYRIQRMLSGVYRFELFCVTDKIPYTHLSLAQYFAVDANLCIELALGIRAKISYECDSHYPFDLQGIDGLNVKNWNTLWKSFISSYSYVYYESKHISPHFIYLDE